ncbi:hypothetical protein DS742_25380 [Lacrimispora amygdalina]|uniref:Swiss Army Knife protein DSP-PTPase phosphatase domain-containing protein n=1 Tax=Lacrimispora amygdalina TaxID=253257 RepID=A0A3E2N536_9FIRM|nr:hypothetical protein [Clostridium indicum]RFZ76109.1 hypothetical protein DS742_25380 [Clostridium indicum]
MSKKKIVTRRTKTPCHIGPVEVSKNLFCGSEAESFAMAEAPIQVDTLVPLNDLNPKIWDKGFRGEILYYPIHDYGTLPDDVLDALISKILDRLSHNKKVGLFCMGGHGRTGYIASIVLGKLGHKDPIAFLRTNYCKQAVESNAQIQHIADVLDRPELVEKYKSAVGDLNDFISFNRFNFGHGYFTSHAARGAAEEHTCDECAYFNLYGCRLYNDYYVSGYDLACSDFTEID